MYAKGNQVPGFAPRTAMAVPQAAPTAMPAPDPTVRATQEQLIRLGYLHGAADGVVGPQTRAAIEKFEQANAMPVDGVASPHLLAVLRATPAS
jgi:peptidoglycan hydrolase-like protein with peptidoglycan-binding domain